MSKPRFKECWSVEGSAGWEADSARDRLRVTFLHSVIIYYVLPMSQAPC